VEPHLRVICLSDIAPEPVQWLWPGCIALGTLTLIAGDPGLGKSMLSVELAAHVTRGTPWPVDGAACPRGGVLIICDEDNHHNTVRPRFDFAGGDTDRVGILDAVVEPDNDDAMLCLQHHQALIAAYLEQHPDVRLVCLDPISSYLGSVDSHKNADVRSLLRPLNRLAAQYNVAIVAISHLNKTGGGNALYRVSGSLAFVAAARASYLVCKDKSDPKRRLLLSIKNNLAPECEGLAYRVAANENAIGRIEWEPHPVDLQADQALNTPPEDTATAERDDIAHWLRQLLANGPIPAKQVQAAAQTAGFRWHKVQTVAKRIGVEKARDKFGKGAGYCWRVG
jgi:hypothetical protein